MKVLALDYGSARTGVAISDATGTLARPLGVIERIETEAGMAHLAEVLAAEEAQRIVVGMPLTLAGGRGEQARATERFVERLRSATGVPVETLDERFTTALAKRGPAATAQDALAASHLLETYLTRASASGS